MNFKNIITNIMGLIFWILAVKSANQQNTSISYLITLVVIGAVLFLFKNRTLITFLNRFLKSKIDGKS